MIICMDVGNTNIKYAVFDGDKLVLSFRVATEPKKTSDEYGGQLISILNNHGVTHTIFIASSIKKFTVTSPTIIIYMMLRPAKSGI